MNKYRFAAIAMAALAVLFVGYAVCNPQASFPWSNAVSYVIYSIYILVTAVFAVLSFKR